MKNYIIKQGDSLSKIAKDSGLSITAIQKLNPIIKDPNKIQAGWSLKLPSNFEEAKATIKLSEKSLKHEDIAAIKKADQLGLVDSAVANSYFERDMKNKLDLQDLTQIKLLKNRLAEAKIPKETSPSLIQKAAKELRLMKELRLVKKEKPVDWKKFIIPSTVETVFWPVIKILGPAFKKYNEEVFKGKILPAMKNILLKGLPTDEEMQKAIDRIEELKKLDLPEAAHSAGIKRIIDEMKVR